jgi:hypothetical protein
MKKPKTLPSFTPEQKRKAHILLATRVAYMMGRKMEEGDWSWVYCGAKGIPERGWSNLKIDVTYEGLGVEHKMLRVPSDKAIRAHCGTRPMHPAATRSIRIPATDDPNEVMRDVLTQYAGLIEERKAKLREDAPSKEPDLRTGWLLWQSSLREFLYFEEETLPPDPKDYFAVWQESGGGSRKASKNVWVYESETKQKRYSITTTAGAKIQPYFDVPPPDDPNLYIFKVQGEEVESGLVRVWVTAPTARELERIIGDLSSDNLSAVLESFANEYSEGDAALVAPNEEAKEIVLLLESYNLLTAMFPGAVSDEHMMQLLATRLRD